MSALPNDDSAFVTPEAYLAFERASDTKHEYLDGDILAMAGASLAHNTITGNLSGLLYIATRGRGCRVLTSDMRTRATGKAYFYPDVSVVCGEPRLADDQRDILTNPTVVIEVLSPSTEKYDKSEKWLRYQQMASLRAYVLVAQDVMRVESYQRREEEREEREEKEGTNTWLYQAVSGPEDVLRLTALQTEIKLSEIYEGVSLAASDASASASASSDA